MAYIITVDCHTFNGEDMNVSDVIEAVSLDMKSNKKITPAGVI